MYLSWFAILALTVGSYTRSTAALHFQPAEPASETFIAQHSSDFQPLSEDVIYDAVYLETSQSADAYSILFFSESLPPTDLIELLDLDLQIPEAEAPPTDEQQRSWIVTVYGGRLISSDLESAVLLRPSGYEDSGVFGVSLARTLLGNSPLSLEAEGQILQHFGSQGYLEGTIALILRWDDFYWDDVIDTSFAIGEGLSYATSIPVFESDKHGESAQLLNYLLFELTFALPDYPKWQFVGRIHHRSGAYGLFNGVRGGSNVYVTGIRYQF